MTQEKAQRQQKEEVGGGLEDHRGGEACKGGVETNESGVGFSENARKDGKRYTYTYVIYRT